MTFGLDLLTASPDEVGMKPEKKGLGRLNSHGDAKLV